jgi:heme-degrading monooxygenase HmoA
MTDVYASGEWRVRQGQEQEFVRQWHDFVMWGQREHADGFERGRLLRDERDSAHFVSFLEWDDSSARDGWRDDAELMQRVSKLEDLCREVRTGRYEEASGVG